MERDVEDELAEYRASGLRMKGDFDYMLKDLLTTLGDIAQANGGVLAWQEVRQIVLDYVNKHRRDMSVKYLVRLRDELERRHAVQAYRKMKQKAE